MSEEQLIVDARDMPFWRQHKFMVLVGATIVISLLLVGIAMALYNLSGAAQLDLSRPGYVTIQDKSAQPAEFRGYDPVGDIDSVTLDEFRQLYIAKVKEATGTQRFGGTVLSDENLGINSEE